MSNFLLVWSQIRLPLLALGCRIFSGWNALSSFKLSPQLCAPQIFCGASWLRFFTSCNLLSQISRLFNRVCSFYCGSMLSRLSCTTLRTWSRPNLAPSPNQRSSLKTMDSHWRLLDSTVCTVTFTWYTVLIRSNRLSRVTRPCGEYRGSVPCHTWSRWLVI